MMAGDTAATTAPITAASSNEMPSKGGATSIIPAISKQAGTKHISTAGRPTFFKSLISKASPARIRMITSAICRSSTDTDNRDGDNAFKA